MSIFFSKESMSFPFLTMIIAVLNASFWFIAARLTESTEIGIASGIMSISILLSSAGMLGIEIPLLKNSTKDKSYFGTSLIFEVAVHLSLIPILMILLNQNDYESLWIIFGIVIFLQTLVSTVTRFCLLGTISVKVVMLAHMIGVIARIFSLIIFLNFGFDATGILLATVIQGFIIAPMLFIAGYKKFNFRFRSNTLKIILKEGISNFPTKISAIMRNFGIITMLVLMNISNEIIAGITITFSLFRFVTIISSSLAKIALPSSTIENVDHSYQSMKIGIVISAPIIVLMITIPETILGFYNQYYIEYSSILRILGISLIPFVLIVNVKIMLNIKGAFKEILILGVIESVVIFSVVLIFVPIFNEVSVAYAILMGFIISGLISLALANKNIKRTFLLSTVCISIGIISGLVANIVVENNGFTAVLSIIGTLLSMFLLKLTSISEISWIVNLILKRKK